MFFNYEEIRFNYKVIIIKNIFKIFNKFIRCKYSLQRSFNCILHNKG